MKKDNKKQKKRRKRLRVPQIIYLAVLIGSTVLVSNRGGAFSYMLFYATLIYLPCSFLYIIYMRVVIRIHQDINSFLLKKRTDEDYTLVLENSGFLPLSGIRLYTDEKITIFRDEITLDMVSLLPKEKREFSTKISCRFAGSYAVGITRISFSDIFDIIRMQMKIPNPLNVQVLPMVTSVAAEDISRAMWDMQGGNMNIRLKEYEDTLGNDVNRYVSGDPINRIHWKNFARSEVLYVRKPEIKDSQLVSVVLNAVKCDGSNEMLSRRDRFLEYAVSVAGCFAKQKRPIQFYYYNAGVKRILVEDYDSLCVFYTEISKDLVLRGDSSETGALLLSCAHEKHIPVFLLSEGDEHLCPV
ncbi:MAG: DUF58 domain-containing protein [Lachnospiraceae bacterium]|nr:DUF58 domain-containing protein [Lachnospiraceae bacterium]